MEIKIDALGVLQLINDHLTENHPLCNILLDCRSLIEEFEAVSIKHIYRESNHCVDALTN